MKNYIKLSIMALSLVGLSSCDMDSPSISSLDESSVFATYSLAEAEIMSIHVSFGETNSYRGRFLPYYGINSDVEWIITPSYSERLTDKYALANYNTTPENSQMNNATNAYAKFYEGIERANLAIKGLRQYGGVETRPNMAHLLGEALTLRAVIYNDLIKAWGDVPARFEPNNAENLYKSRTNRDSIYKQLLADLKEAEGYCYWPNENSITRTTERVSKSFVKSLRARIALYAGGYGLRGDGYRRSKDPELAPEKMYQIAKEECLDVINSGRNTLGEFKTNFTNLCTDNVAAGAESIWEIPFSDGRGRVLYTWGIRHQVSDQYTKQNRGGVNGPLPTLFYDYDVDDIRRDITCIPYRWGAKEDGVEYVVHYNDQDYNVYKVPQVISNPTAMYFGKLRYEWMNRYVTSDNDDGINWQYMRLADVYLMAAEAINELDGPAAAWPYMKPILDRALPAEKVAALQSKYTASKSTFFSGIVEQRAFEFAGEVLRKPDLVRWGIIDQKMAEAKAKLQRLAKREGEYADLPEKVYVRLYENGMSIPSEARIFDNPVDGETLVIYGLNHGDTDDHGKEMKDAGFESKGWFLSNNLPRITDDIINGLYVVDKPSMNCLWPIWTVFITNSNGMLNNDGNYGQLSD
ncbi:MAG: RagB/SusD family nutrient uptake outer membrane protein [Prevotella sp.]|jgi:SusD family.|nr:RagB/SusD family nutrient uptake outer membrane protein [Prevotella sp.]MBQ1701160.1 RagB/SusD family nutrient uptake outer membrane protein [Prevotella sp.]MBQ2215148.1 RagB/SusD family nutrient uptake outer membrane protein [Prevotella sp.]MBQ2494915.1 RagB/SusD family nutrient uptake outer membrane protein [Prevotella sp.]MBQ5577963.1 RagB/SusD family nutrient uptake outer membrane protein [Prevotella sp.]